MKLKAERAASDIQKELGNIIFLEAKDEDFKNVTITAVDVSNDLSYAKVYFTTTDNREKVEHDLNNASGFFRSILASRLEGGAGGGIERSISKDYGYTWSSYEINLEEPFIGPGSKVHLMGLASGSLVMINHATTTSRALLYAYLSVDNGETWPYKVALDLRNDLSSGRNKKK